MSRQINQPINQVKLTNVAVVRYNKSGKRFEIACYRNKILDYRAGLETDLTEVLQTDRVFTNVSKGQFAKASDLQKAFDTKDEEAVAKIILEQGNSLQVSDLERQQQLSNTLSQISHWIANHCVHPETGRPYTSNQIKAVLEHNYTVQVHKPIKKQYLDAVKFLKTVLPIERAKMELRLQFPASVHANVQEMLQRYSAATVSTGVTANESGHDICVMYVQIDPSAYRELDDLLQKHGNTRLEIIQQVVTQEGDIDLDQELKHRQTHPAASTAADRRGNGLDSDDSEAAPLVEKLQAVRLAARERGKSADSEEDSEFADAESHSADEEFVVTSRKDLQKQQKKNKKAQRRTEVNMANDAGNSETLENAAVGFNSGPPPSNGTPRKNAGEKSCNTCGGIFANAADYREHFRSDWHRFNQKLKLKGVPPVCEQEFMLCDAESFFGAANMDS